MKGLIIAAACAAVLAATPVLAADLPAGGMPAAELVAWLQKAGYPAQVKKGDSYDYITSAAEGYNFNIDLYDCHDTPRCGSIRFVMGIDLTNGMTLQRANEWNHSERYTSVFLDDENDPYLGYDVNLTPGVTYESLNDSFGTWRMMLRTFRDFLAE